MSLEQAVATLERELAALQRAIRAIKGGAPCPFLPCELQSRFENVRQELVIWRAHLALQLEQIQPEL